jgi:hypothetical protein
MSAPTIEARDAKRNERFRLSLIGFRQRAKPGYHYADIERLVTSPMRRWLLILLLLIYPFQVSFALADRCCLATAAGVTHHAADAGQSAQAADDGYTGAADPHCAACTFGHAAALPPLIAPLPMPHTPALSPALPSYLPASHLPGRPDRPQWHPAAT